MEARAAQFDAVGGDASCNEGVADLLAEGLIVEGAPFVSVN